MAAAHSLSRGKRDVDMTEGSIPRHIINFAFPLLIGNIFQQLYNTVDTWVVGNYVSNEAFSAVGTVGPIINTLIGFFMGLSSGAGVVISQYYGAKRPEKVHDAVHTAIVMTLVLGIVFTAVGILMIPAMLNLMKTPAEVMPESSAYLTIYFAGILGLMLYNMGAGILRAVGDSKRPFYFLVVSAVLNTVLDLVFVLQFNMGVRGVAYATIIAQGVSAVLILITLMRSESCIRLTLWHLKISWEMLGKIVRIGIPAAIQMAVTAFSNIFVQSYINYFGADCMSGWTAYSKIDQLILLPVQSIALASTTFVGQNLGINRVERAKRGVRTALCPVSYTHLIEGREHDDLVSGVADGHHCAHHGLCASAGHNDFRIRVDVMPKGAGLLVRKRTAEVGRAEGNGILVRAGIGGLCERIQDLARRVKIREPLGKVDRAMLVADAGHAANDGIGELGNAFAQFGHIGAPLC